MGALNADLWKSLETGVKTLDFELVDVELFGAGRHTVLRVYIDRSSGVTVDDCACVSQQLSAILDVEDRMEGPYTLEVSSPGLDRPLKKRDDFRRFAGEMVRIRTREPVGGQRNFTGHLVGVSDDHVVLTLGTKTLDLAFDSIEKARLIPKL